MNDEEKESSRVYHKSADRYKYFNSLSQTGDKTTDSLLWKLMKKRQTKNARTLSDKQFSNSTDSLDLLKEIYSDEKWMIVNNSLKNALLGKTITNFSEVLCSVRHLIGHPNGKFIIEFYETIILKNTLQKLQRRTVVVQDLESNWLEFFRKSLPNIILILSPLKTQQEYVERITLFEFKRRLTKVEDLKAKLINKKKDLTMDWSIIQHMFLVLQAVRRNDNEVSDIDIQFEEIASVLISPLIGYSGIFIDSELVHKCMSLTIAKKPNNLSSNKIFKKTRAPLTGVFSESKSLWDISGKF